MAMRSWRLPFLIIALASSAREGETLRRKRIPGLGRRVRYPARNWLGGTDDEQARTCRSQPFGADAGRNNGRMRAGRHLDREHAQRHGARQACGAQCRKGERGAGEGRCGEGDRLCRGRGGRRADERRLSRAAGRRLSEGRSVHLGACGLCRRAEPVARERQGGAEPGACHDRRGAVGRGAQPSGRP